MYQVSSESIAINQNNVTTAAPEALYVWQPNTDSFNVISGKGNSDNYLQLNIQNTNQGVSASSDVVATANNGDENNNYINMGINSENFNGPIGEGNDAYLYATGNNLHIGNTKAGKHLGFFVGGDNADTDKKLQLNPTGHHQMTGSLDIDSQVTASRFVTRGATAADFVKGDGSLDNTLYTSASVFNNTTSSLQAFSASMLSFTASTLVNSASFDTRIKYLSSSFEFATASLNAFSSSMLNFTASQKDANGTFATTGSNTFNGDQTINGSIILDNGAVIKDNSNNSVSFGYLAAETNQGTQSVAIGNGAGYQNQSNQGIAIGANAGAINQGQRALALGSLAGSNTQGEYAIAIGNFAAPNNQASHSIVISAIGSGLENTTPNSLVIAPIRNVNGDNGVLQYNTTTKEVSYATTLNGITNLATTGSNIFKGNQTITGSLSVSGSTNIYGTTNITGSVNVSGSTGTAITANVDTIVFTGSYAQSGSVNIQGTQTITGSLIVSNTITAERLIVQYISSSVIYSSGSNKFGDEQSDVQQFTGSVDITGSLTVNGRNYITDSGSFDKRINYISSSFEAATSSLNLFSASMLSTTASLNAFSSSVLNFTASTLVNSASFDTRINYVSTSFEAATASLNLFSASMLSTTASVNAFSASMLSFTASTLVNSASFDTRINYLSSSFEANTASFNAYSASMNAFSASILSFTASALVDSASFDTRIGYVSSSFEAATASLNLFSASVLSYTASNNEVIAKLYAETSSLLANTASMNLFSASILSYTASNNEFVADMLTETASLQAATASLNANSASMNLFSASMLSFTSSTLVNSASFDTRINYLSSSFEANTASLNSFTASFNAFSSSILNTTASMNAFSASMLSFTASQKNSNGTFATTGSNTFIGNQVISGSTSMTGSLSLTGSQNIIGNLTVTDTITAQRLVVQFITSSVAQITGSTKFGDEVTDTHQFTGSVLVSGSLVVNGRDYITDSGSFDKRINYVSSSFEAATASLNLFSASILSYTASNNEFVADILTETASLQAATASLNLFSASVLSFTASTLVNSASFDTRINYVSSSFEAATASLNAFSASILNYTASNNAFVVDILLETASLQAATASLNLFSASMLSFTASQKDANGTFATTGSNVFIGSQTVTGSLITSGSNTLIGTTTLTGSISMSGSIGMIGSITASSDVNVGGVLKLRPATDPGNFNETASYLFTSASNTETGYDLYYRQQNNLVKFKWLEGGISTGLLYGGNISYSGSTIFVKPGSGIINNNNASTGSEINPIFTYVKWSSYTASATYLTSSQNTYLYVDASGNIFQQTSFFNQTQYEQAIPLGRVTHPNYISITGVGSNVQTTYDSDTQQNDFIRAFGPLKVSGFAINAHTGSLGLGIGNGIAYNLGGFYTQDPNSPSHYESVGFATASIARAWRSGSGVYLDNNGGAFYNTVDPDYWDDGTGTLNTMNAGDWQIQRVFSNPVTGRTVVYYGQTGTYTNLLNALQYLATDPFEEGEFTAKSLVFVGYLVLKGQTNDLADSTNNRIINAGIFRNIAGGSSGGSAVAQRLENLSDVIVTTPSNGQALVYDGGNWINGNPLSSSYAANADLLDGLNSTQFVLTSSFQNYSASMQAFSASILNYTASNNATITKLYAETASILSYTASAKIDSGSVSTRLVNLEAFSSSLDATFATDADLNALSSSFIAYTASLNEFSASILSYTASNNITISQLYAETASILNYTASNNVTIQAIHAETASILAHTASINAFSASINAYTSSNNDAITSLYSATASLNAFSASVLNYTSSVNGTISAIYAETASIQAFSASILNFTASQKNSNGTFATTGSNTFEGVQTINSNLVVTGSITAQTLVVQTITSSVDFVTGSTHFGTIIDNTHQFTGSVSVSGSLAVNDSNVILTNQTSSMSVATASQATNVVGAANRILFNSAINTTTTSNNLTWEDSINLMTLGSNTGIAGTISKIALYTSSFGGYGLGVSPGQLDYVSDGSHVFYRNGVTPTELVRIANNGDVNISGSLNVINGITGNLTGTASTASYWSGSINNALSASYALTASHATNVPETASFANNATSASYALTASFALNVPETASFALTASYWSGSIINAQTASYVVLAQSASYWSGSIQNAVSAAFADLANSASFASTASFALNGGGGGLSALYIQDEGITQGTASYIDFIGAGVEATVTNGTASITISGGGSGTAVQGASVQFTMPTASTTWSINHAINSRTPVVEVYDNDYNVIIPTGIQNPAPYQTNIYFDIAQRGYAVISTGGVLSVSGSNAILNQNVSSSTWTFNHQLNNLYPVFTIFDSNDDVIIPQRIHVVDTGSAVIYFSSPRTGTAVASVAGNQTFALSSSLAATASLALTAISSSYAATSSFVTLAQTASFVTIAQTASFVENAQTASFVTTAQTASFVQNAQSASYWSGSINNVLSASYAATASHADNFTVAGTLTAQTLVIQTITSSVIYSSGSNVFGNDLSNTQQLTGSVSITGSLAVNGSNVILSNQTSSMSVATASFTPNAIVSAAIDFPLKDTILFTLGNGTTSTATINNVGTASLAETASFAPLYLPLAGGTMTGDIYAAGRAFTFQDLLLGAGTTFGKITTDGSKYISIMPTYNVESARFWPNGNVTIQDAGTYVDNGFRLDVSGSGRYTDGLTITGSVNVSGGVTGSLQGTASYSTTSSYALTASFALNGGGGGISAISIADEGILLGSASYFDFTGAGVSTIVNAGTASFTISGGGSGTQGLTTTFTQSSAAVSWSFTHNLNTRTPVVQVYDSGYNQITPQYISSSDASTVVIGFGIATTGYAVISTGGTLYVTGSNVILDQTASAATWSFNHGLNTQYPIFQVFDSNNEVIVPTTIKAVDSASALIYFPIPVSGKAVASLGGVSGSGGSGAGFPFSGSAVITGSFLVSGSFVDFTQVDSFTGNLTGTASYATFALTASTAPGYTVQFSQTASATTWSFTHNMGTRNPIVQVYDTNYKQIIPNDIVGIDGSTAEIRFDYAQAGYAVMSNGGGLYITGSTSTLIQTSAATTWSFNHQLNTKYPAFEVYDENDLVIIPAGIKAIDVDNAEIYFAGAQAGRAIANFSGINGLQDNAVSASYASSGSVFHVDKVVMDRSLMDFAQVNSSIVGSNNMFTQATGSYTSMFVNYTVASGSNARSGQIIAVWNAGTTEYNDVSTNDIGDTSAVTGSVSIVTGEAQLNFQTNTSAWRIKSTATFM
jgi:hypothetical protein